MALRIISSIRYLLLTLTLLAAGFRAYGWLTHGELPPPSEILTALDEGPVQTETSAEPFVLRYRDAEYFVEPQADYLIRGLVVSHNDINAFADIYHDSDSVDVRDLCVVWGENTSDNRYREVKFWSEPWSCHWDRNNTSSGRFNFDEIANNHILAANGDVLSAIKKVNIGDQVELRGKLINYFPKNYPLMRRSTSLVRDDTGNGACEVLLVEQAEVLSAFRPVFHQIDARCQQFLPWLALFTVLVLLLYPYAEYRLK